MIYLITFACYGHRMHGGEAGSVDRAHNIPGAPLAVTNAGRAAWEREHLGQPLYNLDQLRREVVLTAIQKVCVHRGWSLLAAHVRTNHVHTVVDAEVPPERIMNDFKAYASRSLNQMKIDEPGRKRWARHGSTRWL